jgi:hypothetical protein
MKIKHCGKREIQIRLVVEMRSDAGEEYDYEAIEVLPPALAQRVAFEMSEML